MKETWIRYFFILFLYKVINNIFLCRLALDVEVQALLLQFVLISAENFAEDSVEGRQEAAALLRHLVVGGAQIQPESSKI